MTAPRRGHLFHARGKLYGRCYDCGGIVRVDKPLLGSLHLCVPEDYGPPPPKSPPIWRRRK